MFSNDADCGNGLSNADCGNHMMGGWYDTPWMWLAMLVLAALLIAGVYLAVRRSASSGDAPQGPGATEILGERLARGEISSEEYRDRLAALELSRVASAAPPQP